MPVSLSDFDLQFDGNLSVSASGSSKLLLVSNAGRSGGNRTLTNISVGATTCSNINSASSDGGIAGMVGWGTLDDSSYPSAGSIVVSDTWTGAQPTDDLYAALEFTGVDQATPIHSTPVTNYTDLADGATASLSITGASGKFALVFVHAADEASVNTETEHGLPPEATLIGESYNGRNRIRWGYISSIASASESYDFTVSIDGANSVDSINVGAIILNEASGGGLTEVTVDLSIVWDSLSNLNVDLLSQWNLYTSVDIDSTGSWNLLSSIAADTTTSWNIGDSQNACVFDDGGYLTAPTLGVLLDKKVRIVCQNVIWNQLDGFLWSAGGSTVELGIWKFGSVLQFTAGGILTEIDSSFGSTPMTGEVDFELDFRTGMWVLRFDGVATYSGKTTVGSSRADGGLFRIGARGTNNTSGATTGTYYLRSGEQVGDTKIWLNDVLVRHYKMPESGLSVTEGVGSQDATCRGSFDGSNFTGTSYSLENRITHVKNLTQFLYQRDGSDRTFTIEGELENSSVNSVEARIMQGVSEVVTWQPLSLADNDFSGNITVPAGEGYSLEVRALDVGDALLDLWQGAVEFNIGDIIPIIGDSNSVYWFGSGDGTANSSVYFYDGSSWDESDGSGSGAAEFGNKIQTETGLPVGLVQGGDGGSQLAQWIQPVHDGFDDYSEIHSYLNYEMAVVVALIGYNDAGQFDIESAPQHKANFQSLVTKIQALKPGVKIFNVGSQRGVFGGLDIDWRYLWRAEMELAFSDQIDDLHLAATSVNFELADQVHLTGEEYAIQGERVGDSVAQYLVSDTIITLPRIVSAVEISDTVTRLTISGNAVTLTPSTGITGFTISDNNFSTELTITSVDVVSSTEVDITHTATTAQQRVVRYQYQAEPDITSPLVDGLGIPVTPLPTLQVTPSAPTKWGLLSNTTQYLWSPISSITGDWSLQFSGKLLAQSNTFNCLMCLSNDVEWIGIAETSGFFTVLTNGKTTGQGTIPCALDTEYTVRIDYDSATNTASLYVDDVFDYSVQPSTSSWISSLDEVMFGRSVSSGQDECEIEIFDGCQFIDNDTPANNRVFSPTDSDQTVFAPEIYLTEQGGNDAVGHGYSGEPHYWTAYADVDPVTEVTLDLGIAWSLSQLVNMDSDLTWLTLNQMITDGVIQWNNRNLVITDSGLTWDTKSLVDLNSTLNWSLNIGVVNDSDLEWNTSTVVSIEKDLIWNVANIVDSNFGVQWDINSLLFADSDISWGIVGPLAIDLDINWNLNNSVSNDVAYQWQLLNEVNSSLITSWNNLNSLSVDSDVTWDLLELLNVDSSLQWTIGGPLVVDVVAGWQVLTTIQNELSTPWNVLNTLFSDHEYNWNLLQQINKDSDLAWVVKQLVNRNVSFDWNMFAALTQIQIDITTQWSVLNSMLTDISVQWESLEQISLNTNVSWEVIGRTETDVTVRWHIESLNSFPDITGEVTVSSLTKKYTVETLTKSFKL